MTSWDNGRFTIISDKSALDVGAIHKYLSERAYWSLHIPSRFFKELLTRVGFEPPKHQIIGWKYKDNEVYKRLTDAKSTQI